MIRGNFLIRILNLPLFDHLIKIDVNSKTTRNYRLLTKFQDLSQKKDHISPPPQIITI